MWYWFGFALLALIGEVFSGTFYLLLIALGLVAGGLVALAGWSFTLQLVAVGVFTGLGLWALRKTHFLKKREINAARNRDVNMDIGQVVMITRWGAGQTTQVRYRGALWSVRLAPGHAVKAGPHRITEVDGSILVVTPEPAGS